MKSSVVGSLAACVFALFALGAPARAQGAWAVFEVDPASSYAGYENSSYAVDGQVVYVAYKQFLQDPLSADYVPAALKVAKTTDGGSTWSIAVVDSDAIQAGGARQQSISIGGAGDSAVYVSYLVRSSAVFADMKLKVAKSVDGGSTWATTTAVPAYGGDYNSIKVVDIDRVLISFHGEGPLAGFNVASSADGGASWSIVRVDSTPGAGLYTSIDTADGNTVYSSYYHSLWPERTDENVAKSVDGGSSWTLQVADNPGRPYLSGLGSSMSVVDNNTVYLSYEMFNGESSIVRVTQSADGGQTWSSSSVDRVPSGDSTSIKALASGNVYVSYAHFGQRILRLAKSIDGGVTWMVIPVPNSAMPTHYLHLDVGGQSVFISYLAGGSLKLARLDEP